MFTIHYASGTLKRFANLIAILLIFFYGQTASSKSANPISHSFGDSTRSHRNDHPVNSHLEIPGLKHGEKVITHTGYSFSYNEEHEQANWIAYELTAEETQKAFERTNKFIPDPSVTTGSAEDDDYRGSGYDRGHLAPAADMGWSQKSMEESFYFSNMSPQVPSFNRGIWKKLEEQVRIWGRLYDGIYIVTGPVLTSILPKIGPNGVSVPELYYKAILDYNNGRMEGIGFLLPNAASSENLQHFAVSIDQLEQITGIDFFSHLTDADEKVIEQKLCVPCWEWKPQKSSKKRTGP